MLPSRASAVASSILVCACLAAATPAFAERGASTLSAQGGWWQLELEYSAPFELYVAGGLVWLPAVTALADGVSFPFTYEAAIGYRTPMGEHFSWGSELRAFAVYSMAGSCVEGGCGETAWMLDLPVRYRFSNGFLVGANLPVLALYLGGDIGLPLIAPFSLLLTQAYFGWSWDL